IAYGDPLPTFTWTVQGLPSGATVTQNPTCGVAGSPTNVGTYPITCSGTKLSGAFPIETAMGTLTITTRGINVVPSAAQTYGGTPSFTYTASGMLPGHTVTGSLTCSGATPTSAVGVYPLTSCSGLSVTNGSQYAITYL